MRTLGPDTPDLKFAMFVSIRNTIKRDRLAQFAWFLVGFNILIIAWGALVRATGSGAGCGNHWPTCNGDVLPELSSVHTIIELSHRLSTTVDGLLVILLVIWVWQRFPRGHRARRGALGSLIFIIIEGAIGAALVRLELVEDNASLLRAIAVAGHLANTLILLAYLTLTAWWVSGGPTLSWSGRSTTAIVLASGLAGMIILSAAGAVTALGDTLFPAESLAAGLQADFSPTADFLIRLRVWHPLLAVVVSLYLVLAGVWLKRRDKTLVRPVGWLFAAIAVQMLGGVINILLLVPIWLQLLHLALADLLWILLVIVTAIALQEPAPIQLAPLDAIAPQARNGQHAGAAFTPTKDGRPG